MPTDEVLGHPERVPRSTIATWDPQLLRAILRERGWTITQLAIALDASRASVSNWFYGGTPSPAALAKVAQVLQVATTDLAPLSDDPTLHEYRWHAGLTAAELAAEIGLSGARVSAQLRGEDGLTHREKWCAALDVDLNRLQAAWLSTRRQAMPSA